MICQPCDESMLSLHSAAHLETSCHCGQDRVICQLEDAACVVALANENAVMLDCVVALANANAVMLDLNWVVCCWGRRDGHA